MFDLPEMRSKDPDTWTFVNALNEIMSKGSDQGKLSRYISEYPGGYWTVRAAMLLAQAYMDMENLQEAERFLLLASKAAPTPVESVQIELLLGRHSSNTGAASKAVGHFERSKRLLHDIPEDDWPEGMEAAILFGRANALYESGRIATAEVAYEGALESFPDDPLAEFARVRLARCAMLLHKPVDDSEHADDLGGSTYWGSISDSYGSFLDWFGRAKRRAQVP